MGTVIAAISTVIAAIGTVIAAIGTVIAAIGTVIAAIGTVIAAIPHANLRYHATVTTGTVAEHLICICALAALPRRQCNADHTLPVLSFAFPTGPEAPCPSVP
jgi:hypothetical protein